MPDFVMIGNHAYALTLNLFITSSIGLVFAILLFRYQRSVRREDEERKKLIESKEKADAERHEAVIESVKTLKEALGDKSDTLFQKLDDFCRANVSAHDKMKRNFWKHKHIEEEIVIRDYEP